jgi:choline dehydrogenase
MRKVLEQQPVASRILAEQQPGLDLQSDDELTAYMKQQGGTSWHPAGTCRMAPRGAADGVVDPKLRVNGIAGLRIADASIMPRITSGNTHAPTVMIAENAAAMILSNR